MGNWFAEVGCFAVILCFLDAGSVRMEREAGPAERALLVGSTDVWGRGLDPQLTAVLQWIAVSIADIPLMQLSHCSAPELQQVRIFRSHNDYTIIGILINLNCYILHIIASSFNKKYNRKYDLFIAVIILRHDSVPVIFYHVFDTSRLIITLKKYVLVEYVVNRSAYKLNKQNER